MPAQDMAIAGSAQQAAKKKTQRRKGAKARERFLAGLGLA
jgi:hypothetical protein